MNNLQYMTIEDLEDLVKSNPELLDAVADEMDRRTELSMKKVDEEFRFTKHRLRFIDKRTKDNAVKPKLRVV